MLKAIFKIKSLQPFLLLILGGIFLFIGRFEVSSYIRMPLSYVFEPVSFTASMFGDSLTSWGTALFDASAYIQEYNEVKKELFELKAKEFTVLDYEEYQALKLHTALLNAESQYVNSKIVNISDRGDLYINQGIEDGIKEGNIVVIGNIFLGVVVKADLNGSTVRLPTNKASSYEVAILPSTFNTDKEVSLDGFILSSGVVSGASDGIHLENIGINSKVTDGDIVVLRDERIGELLVLGRLVGLSENPASTSKSGYVSPFFDYSSLLTVFVKVK